jgi:hypothetical protein
MRTSTSSTVTRFSTLRARLGRRRAAAVTLAALGLALLAAACGSQSPTSTTTGGVSGASGASAGGPAAQAFAFARCMRTHGIPNFPDPVVSTSNGATSIKMVAPSNLAKPSVIQSAQSACAKYAPGPGNARSSGGPGKAAFLAFARCLRSHGLTNFPDPNQQGQITIEMINAAGINLHAPNVLPAAKACVGATRGAITGADVERAINGPH